jgi:hypothetical protein
VEVGNAEEGRENRVVDRHAAVQRKVDRDLSKFPKRVTIRSADRRDR